MIVLLSTFRRCWAPSSARSSFSVSYLLSKEQTRSHCSSNTYIPHIHNTLLSFGGPRIPPGGLLFSSSSSSSSSSSPSFEEIKTTLSDVVEIDKNLLSSDDEHMILLLMEYRHKNGDCHVPVGASKFYQEERKRLGVSNDLAQWIIKQRKQYTRTMRPGGGKLTKSFQTRLVLLESMGFIWSNQEAQWQRSFNLLVRVNIEAQQTENNNNNDKNEKQQKGVDHPSTTSNSTKLVELKKEDHPNLYVWADEQRKAYKAGRLTPERETLLKEIGFVFDLNENRWRENYNKLVIYKNEHGDTLVPVEYDDDPTFGQWVARQRRIYNSGEMTNERIELLEKLEFSWDRNNDLWESNYEQLREFYAKHGHCRVTRSDRSLWVWVNRQRAILKRLLRKQQQHKNGERLDLEKIVDSDWGGNQKIIERIGLLKNLKMDVDPHGETWREHYDRLRDYKEIFGHVAVENGDQEYRDLYEWISRQRKRYASGLLSKDRIEAMEAIGFVWDGRQSQWQRSYASLCAYKKEHGHFRVEESQTSLHHWVQQQRKKFQPVIAGKKDLDSFDPVIRDQFLELKKINFEWGVE